MVFVLRHAFEKDDVPHSDTAKEHTQPLAPRKENCAIICPQAHIFSRKLNCDERQGDWWEMKVWSTSLSEHALSCVSRLLRLSTVPVAASQQPPPAI